MVENIKKLRNFAWLLAMAPGVLLAEGGLIEDPTGDPVVTSEELNKFVDHVKDILLSVAGIIAVAMIIWGAVILGTAGGNEEKVGKGKKILTYAVGGLILVLLSNFLVGAFIQLLGGGVK